MNIIEVAFTAVERGPTITAADLEELYDADMRAAGLDYSILPYVGSDKDTRELIERASGLVIAATREQMPNGELFLGGHELGFVEIATDTGIPVFVPEHESLRGAEVVYGKMAGEQVLRAAEIIKYDDFSSIRRSLEV